MCLLVRNVYSDPLPVFSLGCLTFCCLVVKSYLCILDKRTLTRYMISKYFFPSYGLSLHFLECAIRGTEVFSFNIHFSVFYLAGCLGMSFTSNSLLSFKDTDISPVRPCYDPSNHSVQESSHPRHSCSLWPYYICI